MPDVKLIVDKVGSMFSSSTTLLDIGAGQKNQAKAFKKFGFDVDTVDLQPGHTFVGDYNKLSIDKQYDVVFVCHCLEHQLNVNNFLQKCRTNCKEDGHIVVVCPPGRKYIESNNTVVGGHVTLWDAGLIMYNLILAGFDCSNAKVKTYGHNVCVIAQKKEVNLSNLVYDRGDINTLKKYFPRGIEHGKYGHFNGDIGELNW